MTDSQYPGYSGDGSQSGDNPQGAPGYGAQPGYGPQGEDAPGYGPPPGYGAGYGAQPGSNQQPGYGSQPGAAPGYGSQPGAAPGYGPQAAMGAGGGVPPYFGGVMGGVPMSVGDGLSWAWSKFKENALILILGIGLWTILSRAGFDAHVTLNNQDYGVSTGIPFGNVISFVVGLFAPIVIANMSLKVATGRPLEWSDLFAFPNMGAGVLAILLSTLATLVGLLLCIVPGIIVAFLL